MNNTNGTWCEANSACGFTQERPGILNFTRNLTVQVAIQYDEHGGKSGAGCGGGEPLIRRYYSLTHDLVDKGAGGLALVQAWERTGKGRCEESEERDEDLPGWQRRVVERDIGGQEM